MLSIRTSPVLASTALAVLFLHGGASADQAVILKKPAAHLAPAAKALVVKPLKGGNTGIDLVVTSILPEPDPIEGLPNQGYCYKWPVGGAANRVVFAVTNQGVAASPVSTATVTFGNGSVDQTQIVALAPGQDRNVEVGIPPACYTPPGFSGACTFTIAVDSGHVVAESIESNNAVQSLCIQPAG